MYGVVHCALCTLQTVVLVVTKQVPASELLLEQGFISRTGGGQCTHHRALGALHAAPLELHSGTWEDITQELNILVSVKQMYESLIRAFHN